MGEAVNTGRYTIDEIARIVRNAHTAELREACVWNAYDLGKLASSEQALQVLEELKSKFDIDQKP